MCSNNQNKVIVFRLYFVSLLKWTRFCDEVDVARFLNSRDGCEDKILRFGAKLVTDSERDKDREFVINFYVYDSTISVYELPKINSGELINN